MNLPPNISEGIIDAIACMDALRQGDAEGAFIVAKQGDPVITAAAACHLANTILKLIAPEMAAQIIATIRAKALEARAVTE